MNIQTAALAFPNQSQLGMANSNATPGGILGELLVSNVISRYGTLAKSGKLFCATANLTAPVVYTATVGVGGPLLWNRPNSNVDAHILAVSFSSNIVTTVAGGLGLTGNSGQQTAPSTTTAIDAKGNLLIGAQDGSVEAYRIGTVVQGGGFFLPFAQFHTGALTVDNTAVTFVDVGGAIVVPAGAWAGAAGSAGLTTLQAVVSIVWAELPA